MSRAYKNRDGNEKKKIYFYYYFFFFVCWRGACDEISAAAVVRGFPVTSRRLAFDIAVPLFQCSAAAAAAVRSYIIIYALIPPHVVYNIKKNKYAAAAGLYTGQLYYSTIFYSVAPPPLSKSFRFVVLLLLTRASRRLDRGALLCRGDRAYIFLHPSAAHATVTTTTGGGCRRQFVSGSSTDTRRPFLFFLFSL